MGTYQKAISEVLKGIKYIVDEAFAHTMRNYDGMIIANEENGKWKVQFNGEVHSLKPYGAIVPAVGMTVKVFIPNNNMSLAYFI